MTIAKTVTIAALAAALSLASSPAFAWICTAKNAAGASFSAVGPLKPNVQARALAKCKVISGLPKTCAIASCTLP